MGITVVPLYINTGEQGYLDGVEISRQDFYTNLPDYQTHPTTSTPGMDAFTQVYQNLTEAGATEILSIHISVSLSATSEVAVKAAKEFRQIPVTVLDSRQLSMGTGFQVEIAAQMAQQGIPMSEILDTLEDTILRTFVAARIDTLTYLRRSGRMNAILSGLGSLLQVKPILTMADGVPGSERVRTTAKAEARLIQMLEEQQPIERFALLHTNAPQEADAFLQRVSALLPKDDIYSMNITPVIGAHVGPGAVGFASISKNQMEEN